MAGDDSRKSCGFRVTGEFRQVMNNVDSMTANLDHVMCEKAARPSTSIVIAAYSSDGRNASKRIQNRWIADIPAMNDDFRVAQRIERFRPNQAMGIRYQADEMRRRRHVFAELFPVHFSLLPSAETASAVTSDG